MGKTYKDRKDYVPKGKKKKPSKKQDRSADIELKFYPKGSGTIKVLTDDEIWKETWDDLNKPDES